MEPLSGDAPVDGISVMHADREGSAKPVRRLIIAREAQALKERQRGCLGRSPRRRAGSAHAIRALPVALGALRRGLDLRVAPWGSEHRRD
jgi:hypothetical protein